MYYQNYEDYMRNVLGYSPNDPSVYEPYNYYSAFENQVPSYANSTINTYQSNRQINNYCSQEEIESFYPEIYQKLNPMVCKVCENMSEPLSRELLEKMTDEIYNIVDDDTIVNIRIEAKESDNNNSIIAENQNRNLSKEVSKNEIKSKRDCKSETINKVESKRWSEKKEDSNSIFSKQENRNSVKVEPNINEVNQNNRQFRRPQNQILRDLIKILILKNLWGGNQRPPIRPPRPPFPGGPGNMPPPPPRPPMGPRTN